MADFIRTAKSTNEWTDSDLEAYNIRVEFQDAITFFGDSLPQPTVRPEVLTTRDLDDNIHWTGPLLQFMRCMTRATTVPEGTSSSILGFLRHLFEELSYATGDSMLCTNLAQFKYVICGQVKPAHADFCITHMFEKRDQLLVREDKRYWHPEQPGPESQLIAYAIATFVKNNFLRVRTFGLPAREEEMIPGFTITGTFPIFYKIPVTTALAYAVEEGRYPSHETVVYAYRPEVPRPRLCFIEGMMPLDNRRIIFSCFEAFRQFIQ